MNEHLYIREADVYWQSPDVFKDSFKTIIYIAILIDIGIFLKYFFAAISKVSTIIYAKLYWNIIWNNNALHLKLNLFIDLQSFLYML